MDRATVDSSKLFSVEGMVVVITGGATGIGLMMTKAFANNGAAKVYIVGRRKEVLEEAAKNASPPTNVIPIVGDVTSKEDLKRVADQIKRETGYINLLVCNSGSYPPNTKLNPREVSLEQFADDAMEQKPEDWASKHHKHYGKLTSMLAGFATNTTAVAFNTFAFLKLLDAGNKQGNCVGRTSQVLVTSSVAAYMRNPNYLGCYSISKAATNHLVKCLSTLLKYYSIRVNAIAPGLFPSDLAARLIPPARDGKDPTDDEAYSLDFLPSQRTGGTSDMAGTVLYMASAAGAYLHGTIHLIDGGRMGMGPGTY